LRLDPLQAQPDNPPETGSDSQRGYEDARYILSANDQGQPRPNPPGSLIPKVTTVKSILMIMAIPTA
jgi:hypothetical protein